MVPGITHAVEHCQDLCGAKATPVQDLSVTENFVGKSPSVYSLVADIITQFIIAIIESVTPLL